MRTSFETIDRTHSNTFPSTSPVPYWLRISRWWMGGLLIASDLLCLSFSGVAAVILRGLLPKELEHPLLYLNLAPGLILFLVTYSLNGLYPGVGLSPVEELRRLSISTSIVFVLATATTFWVRNADSYSRLVFAIAWALALVLVLFGRWVTRAIAIRLDCWGEPVAIVGHGPKGKKVIEYLKKNLHLGLRPVLAIYNSIEPDEEYSPSHRVQWKGLDADGRFMQASGIYTAILVISEMPDSLQREIIDDGRFGFRRLLLITSLGLVGSKGVTPYDLEGILGLEIRQNLFAPGYQILKRLMDLALVAISAPIAMPLMALLALWVRLDTRGKAFYRHERVGKDGRMIHVWKIRTMVSNADQVLQEYLEKHPELQKEWDTFHKLKNDPRVTRAGYFLRKTSLDELPQLINIVKGDMSIVGPRPIVTDEIKYYGSCYALYKRVNPGLTGLWQVSGRNDTDYDTRVQLDEHYVRNWSIWLDIYIIIRTLWVVLRRDGAY